MNPVLQNIFNRRSVRAYEPRDISDDTVRDLLEAGMAAPSAVATDPWHFIVIRDPATRSRVADALPHGQMLKQAPLGLVVCGDMARAHDGQESYMLQDCSAAVENILVAAATLGLGACWLGVHPREERIASLRKTFDLPASIIPVAAIAIGWPTQQPEPRTRYRTDAVHTEAW